MQTKLKQLVSVGLVSLIAGDALANPLGMTVVQGAAQATQQGSQLNITAAHNAFLQWNSFNIAAGETTRFIQPSASSVVWNRITDVNPSTIYGNLQANGMVVLANQNGFFFGPDAFVQAAGLVVTTTPIAPGMSLSGGANFGAPPPGIPIINYGHLVTENGGALFLIARKIENQGTIEAPGGSVGLLAGSDVMISERPDGRGLSARVSLPAGLIDNRGRITADAGHVLLHAQTVNQAGVVQANSVRERNGVIELFAAEQLNLEASSQVLARGDANFESAGGQIVIKSAGEFVDHVGSIVSAAGGAQGGNGGQIEISAPRMVAIRSQTDAAANEGYRDGDFLIDPTDIVLSSSGSGSAGNGTVGAGDAPGTLNLNVDTAFQGFSTITLQATRNITLRQGTTFSLPQSTGIDQEGSILSLQAGNNLVIENNSRILAGQNWSISLMAGADFSGNAAVIPGVGDLNVLGSGLIEAGGGDIRLAAGRGISLGQTAAVRTMSGGSINARAYGGNLDAGSNPNGFQFSTGGYSVSPILGGISTAGGGDVLIQASGDVRAYLPPASGQGSTGEAGVGAYGAQAGNVTVIAGGNITGHFVVRNGVGSIEAGGNAGTTSRSLALSLVKGSWTVDAGNSIVLQEVRNPNGIFNSQAGENPFRHLFDYDPLSAVYLNADHGVNLTGALLPRPGSAATILPIYPPTLSISAGAGGIELANRLSLFPSAVGNLDLVTVNGGNLRSSNSGLGRYIVLSDSDQRQWQRTGDFTEGDRGTTALHLVDPISAHVVVSGSMTDINLVLPKPAEIVVAGDIRNSSASFVNFRSSDRSSVTAGGQIVNRNLYSFIIVEASSAAPRMDLLPMPPDPLAPDLLVRQYLDPALNNLQGKIIYDPVTRRLGFAGRMTQAERDALLNVRYAEYVTGPKSPLDIREPYGPFDLADPQVVVRTAPFASAEIINQLYAASQDVPLAPLAGFVVEGPGKLSFAAAALDLGVSQGIASRGFSSNPSLVPLTSKGADVDINLAGDLDMFSSTILSQYGGDISIAAGGRIDVGSQLRVGGGSQPRGIVSLGGGDIDIVAQGNVQVNGSRVASYDGGDIRITSLFGDVDAGAGGTGFIRVSKPYWDAEAGQVQYAGATIPGSGILATSFPTLLPGETTSRMGNITIETPRGDIIAKAGGIVQIALNDATERNARIELIAGTRDGDTTVFVGNIEATGSGVIGSNVRLDATGDIKGVVVASQSVTLNSSQNVNVTVVSSGSVNVSAAGSVTGTFAGAGNVSVSGDSVGGTFFAGGGLSVGGDVSGGVTAATGPTSVAANADAAQASEEVQKSTDVAAVDEENDEDKKKEKSAAKVKQFSGRVSVILPPKK